MALTITGALLMLTGGVWFLQGINILPGSFMTGQTKWAVYGGLLLIAGIGLLILAISFHYFRAGRYYQGEYYFLLLCSLLGTIVMEPLPPNWMWALGK